MARWRLDVEKARDGEFFRSVVEGGAWDFILF